MDSDQPPRASFAAGTGEARNLLLKLASALRSAEIAPKQTVVPASSRPGERSDVLYRALVEQIPAVTFLLALDDGEIDLYVSPQIEKLLGFTQEEWLSDPELWFRQLHPDDRPRWNSELARGVSAGGPFRAECRAIARDGEIKYVRGDAWLVRDDAGNPLMLQGIAQDITEIKKAEVAVREAADVKVRTERLAAVGQFAASVGHDLRNPLSSVRNAMHFIRKRVGQHEDARVRQFLDLIDKELRTANRIIGDLLDFARARPPLLSKVTLHEVVEDAVSIVHAPRPVTIDNRVPAGALLVEVDRDQFRQVLVNLLQNAAESLAADRDGWIRVTAEAAGGAVVLRISDNGVGIPSDQLERIFEPLFTTKSRGTGLGLAIVSNIVRSHRGEIAVASRPGDGTTFTVQLPLAAGARNA